MVFLLTKLVFADASLRLYCGHCAHVIIAGDEFGGPRASETKKNGKQKGVPVVFSGFNDFFSVILVVL